MNLNRYLLLGLVVFLLVASASAATYNFGKTHGDSKYEGVIAISDGKVAVSVAAVMEGTMATNQEADDTGDEVGTEQSVEAEGTGIFAGSGASNGDESACTNTIASGEDAAVDIEEQEAEVENNEAEAEQEGAATGDSVSMVAAAENDRGKEAVTVASATGEDATLDMDQEAEVERREAEAEQEGKASGEDVLMVTAVDDGRGKEAVTVASAEGEGATLAGEQEAETERRETEAEQEMQATGDTIAFTTSAEERRDTEVTTSLRVSGAVGTVAVEQEAELERDEAEAEQEIVNAQGERISAVTSVDTRGKEATSAITLRDGIITYAEQEAELEHNEAEAEQEVQLIAERADVTTSAENWRGDSAVTHAGVRNGVINVFQEAEAEWDGVEAEQDGFVDTLTILGPGSAIMDTHIVSSNGNEAHTGAAGDFVYSEQEGGTGSAWVTQDSIVVADDGHASAWSFARSNEGDTAGTIATVFDGGLIQTEQGAAAGRDHFGPVQVDGAAAGQITEIVAFDGALTASWASNRRADEGAASTMAVIGGAGEIETMQGAGAGEVDIYLHHGFAFEADGAVAAQATRMNSTDGGLASSRSTNEFDNFANTEVGYDGIGQIGLTPLGDQDEFSGTIQGAAAGEAEIEVHGHDIAEAEGAIAIQHTDFVTSEELNTVWASSSSNNEFDNFAGTEARATGNNAFIGDTTQGAGAGEIEIFGIEAEGAVAIQDTELISSGEDGVAAANSWSNNEFENFANTGASARNGFIEDTTQGAIAGEVEVEMHHHDIAEAEGAVAIQDTAVISSFDGIARAYSDSTDMWSSASTETQVSSFLLTPGTITDTTQGAGAGEIELNLPHHVEVEVQGSAAVQDTGMISGLNGFASSDAVSFGGDDVAHTGSWFFGIGAIEGTTQGAAVGEAEVEVHHHDVFEAEGAIAAQHTDAISSTFGGGAASYANNFDDQAFAGTSAVYFTNGGIEGTTQGAGAGELELGFGHHELEVEGAIAAQHTDLVYDQNAGSAGSFATDNSEGLFDEGFATTTATFFGEGAITDTTQGGIAGEAGFGDDVYVGGAAAIQHTEEIGSDGFGFIMSTSNNEFENFAFANTFYYHDVVDGEIADATSGALAGEIYLEHFGPGPHNDFEAEGAVAGQYIGFERNAVSGTSAFSTDPVDFSSTLMANPLTPIWQVSLAGEYEDGIADAGAITFHSYP
jgi:hypothetical protein